MPRTIMTRRRTVLLGAVLVGLVAAALWAWPRNDPGPAGLGSRSVQAGEVTVEMTALALDATGARFEVSFDTHSVELDLDPAEAAQLRVDGDLAGAGSWSGDGPGGHHRAGTLAFADPVPPGASVELRIAGLPQDAVGSWTAP